MTEGYPPAWQYDVSADGAHAAPAVEYAEPASATRTDPGFAADDTEQQVADNLKEPAQQAVDAVKDTAADAASTVKDEGTSAAHDVKDQAQDAKDAVAQQ